jgi:geranyl-CoA carboxylase alpha subunit
MNTRLQVEHPVTECVTGLDLVEWQLRVANGERLPLSQDEISFTGHAIEARLCAENPYENFAPRTGEVQYFAPSDAGIRVDAGVESGTRISPYYDSMVAKFIAHGASRAAAVRKLSAALASAPLLGLDTNAEFLKDLFATPEFANARMHVGTIDEWRGAKILQAKPPAFPTIALAASIFVHGSAGHWNRGGAAYGMTLRDNNGHDYALKILHQRAGVTVHYGDQAAALRILEVSGPKIWFERDGVRGRAHAVKQRGVLFLASDGFTCRFQEKPAFAGADVVTDGSKVHAPVAGTLVSILPVGAGVKSGDVIAVIEAMKIETRIPAAMDGVVTDIFAAAGAQVKAKKLLATLGHGA